MNEIMDRQPVLDGARLHLRPLTAADHNALFGVAGDREIWAVHPRHDRWKPDVFAALFAESLASGGALAIIDRATGAMIGSSRYDTEVPGQSVEIGWTFLARAFWGGGVNAELKRLMVAHALRFVPRVDFRVGENNVISRKALANIGAVLTDRSELAETPDGPVVHVIYEIDRANFASGPLAG